MTLPKGWEKLPPINSKNQEKSEKTVGKELKLYNEDEVWKLVTKAITRMMYDMIATYEARGLNEIPIGWIRDYTDDIAVNFPRIQD